MKLKELEMTLQRVRPISSPRADLEQYSTPAVIAADVLFTAFSLGDVEDKVVLDLGCGSGILAIGAGLLGAREVIGLDADAAVLQQARENAIAIGVELELVHGSVDSFEGKVDTVIMNPPFGAQNRNADRPFLEKAMGSAGVVYSLHMASTQEFLMMLVRSLGGEAAVQKRYKFEIPHMFAFHKKMKRDVEVVLLRIQT